MGNEMPLSRKQQSTEIDRVRLEEFVNEYNRACRDSIVGCANPGYPFDQIGSNLQPGYTPGKIALMAQSLGAPKHQVLAPALRHLEFVDSLYPPDDSTCWRAASIASEPADAGFDCWQVTVGPDASDFDLRRGLELALANAEATERFIHAVQTELGKRRGARHEARARVRAVGA